MHFRLLDYLAHREYVVFMLSITVKLKILCLKSYCPTFPVDKDHSTARQYYLMNFQITGYDLHIGED